MYSLIRTLCHILYVMDKVSNTVCAQPFILPYNFTPLMERKCNTPLT